MDLGLAGRTALITGASQGIGRSVAEVFAEEGVNLHLVARSREDLERARDEILARHKVSVTIHPLNLAERVGPGLRFRERGDVAQRVLGGHEHDEPVDPHRYPSVRRDAVAECCDLH